MNDSFSSYLNDHLAGATAAIETLQLLRDQHPGKPIAGFALEMMGQLREDRTVLQNLIDRIGRGPSPLKQAAGWVGARVSELKFTPDSYGMFLALEALSLGVEGRLLMWQAAQAMVDNHPALQTLAFENLVERARKQRAEIELQRMLLGEVAFAPLPVAVPSPTSL